MARVTVEDCIERVPNRFELVMLASQRARKISSGAPLTIDRDNDKNPVVSLRELAQETINIGDLKEELIRSHQRMVAYEEDEDTIDLMDGEEEWSSMAGQAQSQDQIESESAGGMYADEDISEDSDDSAIEAKEPSLADMAGEISEET